MCITIGFFKNNHLIIKTICYIYIFLSSENKQVIYNAVKVSSFTMNTDKKKLRITWLKYIADYQTYPVPACT